MRRIAIATAIIFGLTAPAALAQGQQAPADQGASSTDDAAPPPKTMKKKKTAKKAKKTMQNPAPSGDTE